nr:energy-coupled thiamine transporter ThiT [Clostridia bacterium]
MNNENAQKKPVMSQRTKLLTECAVMVALASVLSMLKIYEAPLGGSVTLFSMVPIIIIAMRRGTLCGLVTGFVYSVIQLVLGLGNVAYVPSVGGIILCILFDYIIAFTLLGLAGIFRNMTSKAVVNVIVGILFVCILRYISHILSGAVVWYEITKAGDWNEYVHTVGMWTYSIIYNIQFMLPETIITLVAAPVCLRVMKLVKK